MLTKQDLLARVCRLEQLIAGLSAELVRLAMEKETLNADEARAYRQRIDTAWPGLGKQLTMNPDGNCGLNLLYCLRQRTDLAPLEGLPLTWLCLEGCTGVESVIPLRGMPLRYLNLWNTSVSDVTPLEWMALEEITLDNKTRWQGMDVLRRMKSLKFINPTFDKRLPAEEFWKKYDAGEINR